ncbi:MAG: sulfatase-like hydrolase/transferase [Reichenbachiella sp.]
MRSNEIKILWGLLLVMLSSTVQAGQSDKLKGKPNIVLIVSDDQGYADATFQKRHTDQITTPAIDNLASEGIVFTQGYASGYVCSPTRAGLLTGRYQQRFGFFRARDSRDGMSKEEITLADYLKQDGYSTGIFGKWHLGLEYDYRPLQRGFDEFYGFLGHGGHSYFDLSHNEKTAHNSMYRGNEIIEDEGYLTDILADESIDFIDRHAQDKNPFFLYLPFNAVHAPLEAPEKDVARFNTGDPKRDTMLGMLYRMDLAIGKVIQKLKDEGIYDNTLIIYFSDNGGSKAIMADNSPLRDYKASTYEGGIRVPFVMSWAGKISSGTNDEPVISLDILPTILDVTGQKLPKDRAFDGKSLIPVMTGNQKAPLHEQLVWDGNEGKWAIRQGAYKLVRNKQGIIELYNIAEDIGESKNIIEEYPEIAKRLQEDYDKWRSEMGEPMSHKDKTKAKSK